MKKLLKSLVLFAAAAMALTSCENEAMNDGIATNDTYTLTFVADAPQSRTAVDIDGDAATFTWSADDQVGFVQYAVGAGKTNRTGSKEIALEGNVATFTTTFDNVDGATAYHYAAYYPYTTPANDGEKSFGNIVLNFPARQTYTDGSFDPNADLLMSKAIKDKTNDGHGGKLEFARLVAVGKMTLKGVEAGETITSVKFSIANAVLAGQVAINFDNNTATYAAEGNNYIEVVGESVGNEIFFTCFPGEYTGEYSIEVETDRATYLNTKTFSKPFILSEGDVLGFVANAGTRTPKAAGLKEDVLNRAFTGISNNGGYGAWDGKTATSGAVYAGQSAGANNSIQLRSSNNNSGVVTTTSGGYVKKIVVAWNSNTASGRILNVYGKNSAYSAATDLYSTGTQGTLLGTIVCGTSTELVVNADYQYIGFRSNASAMYLDEVKITWSAEASGNAPVEPEPEPEVTLTTGSGEGTEASPYDVTRALEAIEKGHSSISSACVKGTISSIKEISTQYGNATYNISVDGTTSANQLTVYRGKGLSGAAFTSTDALHVGDVVVVKGELMDYNGTKEFTTGNQIVSLQCGHAAAITISVENQNIANTEAEGTVPVTVTNGEGYEFEATTTADWLAVEWVDGGVDYVAAANTGAERTATVSIYATDGENEKTVEFTITQAAGESTGGEGGGSTEPVTYTLTITPSSFNGTSYAANNNEKTTKATGSDGSEMEVRWTSNQVMLQSSNMQWQKNKGYIYNSTDLGTIQDITITSTAGSFSKYIGTSKQPTTSGSGGYFQIKVGSSSLGTVSKIVITFTK